ncbi:MAG: glycosyltransferase family 4 protein [Thermoproteota archaeon]
MHIAVLPYTASGGLSTYALELSEALAERGLDVTLLGFGRVFCSKKLRYKVIPQDKKLNIIREPFLWNASIGASASRILKDYSVDIVHCVYPSLVPFIRLHNVIVSSGWFSPHNLRSRLSIAIRMSSFSISKLPELYGQAEYFLLDDLGYNRSDCVFAVTKVLEEDLRKKFGRKVRYLPPGIKQTASSKKIKNDKVVMASVSADLDNPRKGISFLLRALMLIERSLLEKVDIWLIGSYSDRLENELQKFRQRGYQGIKLLGYVQREKILEYLLQTDILVCPSMYEEFGYVVLEAMGAGVPVVATRIRPLKDIISDGVSGLLFEKGDIQELSSRILMLISDQEIRIKMGEEARRTALEEFGWNKISLKMEKYYKDILDSR